MQLLSRSSAASSQSVTHSCPVPHSKPSKWSGPPDLSVVAQLQPALLQDRDVSREGFFGSCQGKIDSVHCFPWSSWTFFFPSKIPKDSKSTPPLPAPPNPHPLGTPNPLHLDCGFTNFLWALMTRCEDCPSSRPFVRQSLPFEFD